MHIRTRSTHRIPLQKDVPAVGPGRRAVLPLDVVGEDDFCGAINALVVRGVVPRGPLRATRIELRFLGRERYVLVIDVLDGVGLDPESYDPNSLVFLRRSLDRPVDAHDNLDMIEQEMLGFSRLVLLPEAHGEASDMVGSRGIHLIRQQRTRR